MMKLSCRDDRRKMDARYREVISLSIHDYNVLLMFLRSAISRRPSKLTSTSFVSPRQLHLSMRDCAKDMLIHPNLNNCQGSVGKRSNHRPVSARGRCEVQSHEMGFRSLWVYTVTTIPSRTIHGKQQHHITGF